MIGTYNNKTVKQHAATIRAALKVEFPDCVFRVTIHKEAIYVSLQRAPVSPLSDSSRVITLLNDVSIANGVNAQERLTPTGFDFMRKVVEVIRRDYWEVNEKNVAFYLSLGVGRGGDPFVATGSSSGSVTGPTDDDSSTEPPPPAAPIEPVAVERSAESVAAGSEEPKSLTEARPIARRYGRAAYRAGIEFDVPGFDTDFQRWLNQRADLGFNYSDLVAEWEAGWQDAKRDQTTARAFGRDGYALGLGDMSAPSHAEFMEFYYGSRSPLDWLISIWRGGWREAFGEREVEHTAAIESGIQSDIAYSFGLDAYVTQSARLRQSPANDTALLTWLQNRRDVNYRLVSEMWWRGFEEARYKAKVIRERYAAARDIAATVGAAEPRLRSVPPSRDAYAVAMF